MSQTVLLTGATGLLGSRIAHHLLKQPNAQLRLLVRNAADPDKRSKLDPFIAQGAEIIEGDISDRDALDRATQGVNVIVSAVQGGPDVIVTGQAALAEIGKRNGVRRILPSDYALDLFKATPGEHIGFNLRQEADQSIAAVGLEQVNMLQGAFMDLFGSGSPMIDYDAGVVTYWGDGSQPIEMTTIEDTARMTAQVALDPEVGSGKFAFAGDHLSFQDMTNIVEAHTGRTFERRSLGSEADLRAAKAEADKDTANPFGGVILAYQLYMLNGQTALSNLQNERYPDIQLETFAQFANRTLPRTRDAVGF